MSNVNIPVFHNIKLAENARLYNLSVEVLENDPVNSDNVARIWFNSQENEFKYTALDENNNLITIKKFNNTFNASDINFSYNNTNPQLFPLQNNTPFNEIINYINHNLSELYKNFLDDRDVEYFKTDDIIPSRTITLMHPIKNKEHIEIYINGLNESDDCYNIINSYQLEFLFDLPSDSEIKIVMRKSLTLYPMPFEIETLHNAPLNIEITKNITLNNLLPNQNNYINIINGQIENNIVQSDNNGILNFNIKTLTPNNYNNKKTILVSVNGIESKFLIISKYNIPDNTLIFNDKTNVDLNVEIISDPTYIYGLTPNTPITIISTSGLFDIGYDVDNFSGIFSNIKTITTDSTGTLAVKAKILSSNSPNTSQSMIVNVGSILGTFTVTTHV